uniref:Methyltransferase domain-containing protein n=1 Tax=candidate division WOR-3 bacterium TaxID=2052148 RepID=A0A7C4X9E7_UNCW3
MMELPVEVEEVILKMLDLGRGERGGYSFPPQRIDVLRKEIVTLTQGFRANEHLEDKFPDAYLAFNFPTNVLKVQSILEKLKTIYCRELKFLNANVLDVGCGDGAGTVGFFLGFKELKDISFLGVDVSFVILERFKRLADLLGIKVRAIKAKVDKNFFKKEKGKFNFIIFSNSLGEIEGDKLGIIKSAALSLSEPGFIIIIEPALKSNSRFLMELKSILKGYNFLLPCMHNQPCPLLRLKNEWCYHSIPWIVPEYLEIINRKLFRDLRYLKFSYLVMGRGVQLKDGAFLVISPVWKEKGRKRFFICRDGKRIECFRPDKEKSANNQILDKIIKGNYIELKNVFCKSENIYVIKKETIVERIT